jgi:hypothetical protein
LTNKPTRFIALFFDGESGLPSSIDYHAFFNWLSAGGNEYILSFYFHKAKSARSKRFTPFSNGTKVRDVNAILQSHP